MKLLLPTGLLLSTSASPTETKITKAESSSFLSRAGRGYHIFEEARQGNFERECIEEDCNQEECLEVSDDLEVFNRMWEVLRRCESDPNASRDHIRRCTERQFLPNWKEWSEWGDCSFTCQTYNAETSELYAPNRVRKRYCRKGINGEKCTGPETQAERCTDLPTCKVMDLKLMEGRLRNASDAVFRAYWNDVKGFDKDSFELKWKINDATVANYRLARGVIMYHNVDFNGRVKVQAEILESPYSEFVLSGPLTEKDLNGTIGLELHWNEFYEQETRNIRDLIE